MHTRPDAPAGSSYRCRVCGSSDVQPLLDLGPMPIAHRLLAAPGEQEDLFAFAISLCGGCGSMQVVNPIDPELLYRGFNYNRLLEAGTAPRRRNRVDPRRRGAALGGGDRRQRRTLPFGAARRRHRDRRRGSNPIRSAARFARTRSRDLRRHGQRRNGGQDGGRSRCVRSRRSRQVLERVPDVATYFATARALLREDGYPLHRCSGYGTKP